MTCGGSGTTWCRVRVWRLGLRAKDLLYDEVKSYRPVNFTDSKTQPFHASSPSPWQQISPLLSRGRRWALPGLLSDSSVPDGAWRGLMTCRGSGATCVKKNELMTSDHKFKESTEGSK